MEFLSECGTERPVVDRAPNLNQQIGAAPLPPHLLSCPFSRVPDAEIHRLFSSRLISLMQACAVEGGH
jgi:hypothetical protein